MHRTNIQQPRFVPPTKQDGLMEVNVYELLGKKEVVIQTLGSEVQRLRAVCEELTKEIEALKADGENRRELGVLPR
jgi:hypothetical protein